LNKADTLVAIETFDKVNTGLLSHLTNSGLSVRKNETGKILDYESNAEIYSGVKYIIAGLEKYDQNFFEKFPSVEAISRIGVGVDAIDLVAAKKNNVSIYITSDKPSVAVAELCIANMISLLRNTYQMSNDLKSGRWHPIEGKEIRNCRIGIVGLGSIGKQVAKRVYAFGSEIIAYGRTWNIEFANKYKIKKVSLSNLIKLSDIITVHLPYEDDTRNIINKKLIETLVPGAVLINTSRSGVIDNLALRDAVIEKKLSGVAIDVFDEHRNISPWEDVENVILTPHIGSHTRETRKAMEETAVSNLLAHYQLSKEPDLKKRATIKASLKENIINIL